MKIAMCTYGTDYIIDNVLEGKTNGKKILDKILPIRYSLFIFYLKIRAGRAFIRERTFRQRKAFSCF